MRNPNRRELLLAGAGLALVGPGATSAAPLSPAAVPRSAKPLVIASANGHQFKNGGPRTAVEEAFSRLVKGEDPLDAVVAGVQLNELDPLDDSVGFGGLANAEGVVQLDSACMHGPTRRAGGVAAIEGVRTPAAVARAVLAQTDHHLLVGAGAQAFARAMGFAIEPDLNTESSRQKWLEWKRHIDPEHWLDPQRREQAAMDARRAMIAAGRLDPEHLWGTIHMSALDARAQIAAVTTTSGLAWKIPGRVGDSPILGAGLYVDNAVGAAGSTGRGEANLYNLTSFLIVENLRRGMHPKDAALDGLARIRAATVEKRLLDTHGQPNFNVKFYVLDRTGRFAGAALWAKFDGKDSRFAVCTENGADFLPCDGLLGEPAPA
jgi:N4-(beta-N-acetylglucosaminyl)-L-asparaginase